MSGWNPSQEQDEEQERVQVLRAVYNDDAYSVTEMPESETVKIECQLDDDGREVILWEDILLVFDNILHVRHGTKVLPFLKDLNFRA